MQFNDSDKKDLLGIAVDIVKNYAAGEVEFDTLALALEAVYTKLVELAEKA